jgi:hypothetical protein
LEDRWKIHQDKYDPEDNPVGHILFDAPELAIAGIGAAFAGLTTFCLLDEREKRKQEDEQNWWFPPLMAVIVAIVVGAVFYVLAALVRVSIGVG